MGKEKPNLSKTKNKIHPNENKASNDQNLIKNRKSIEPCDEWAEEI